MASGFPFPLGMRRVAALLVTLAVVRAGLVSATPDRSSWTLAKNLSHTPGRSFHSALAVNPVTGDAFAAWTDDGVATWEEVMGRRWDHTSQMWLAVENLSQSAEWARDGGPALVFDDQGHGLLVWTRTYSASQGAPASGHDVLWRAWDGAAWSAEQVLMHGEAVLPGSPGVFGLIPVRMPDTILLFITWGTSYRTAEYQDGAWSELSPWGYVSLVSLDQVVADGAGKLHAAGYGPNSNQAGYNYWFDDAYYLTYDGAAWSEPVNLSYTDGIATSIGLAFDGQGRLHFLWSDPDSPFSDESLKSAIWERVYDGASWSPNVEVTADNDAQAINGFSLAAGADVTGTLHLAWSEGLMDGGTHVDLEIYYQAGDGTDWGPEQRVYTSTADSRYPVLAVGSDSELLAWQEIFWAGGTLPDSEVYASYQVDLIVPHTWTCLPIVSK
ncbi:MAG: hypothetical protein JXM73_06230 [Anaerolineae bacterium]|nr:hypothetical protein [Anaerolineae bacterium]